MSRHPDLSVADIKERLSPYFERLGIEKALVFGSFARGTATRRSDIDLIIVMETEKRFFERYDQVAEFESLFAGFHVDTLVYTPEELESISHRPFIQSALQDGIVIYGS